MRLLAVALLLVLPTAAGAVAVQDSRTVRQLFSNPDCPRTTTYHAWQRGKALKPQRLADLPDANAYKAVLRHDGRCEVPVVVKHGVSGR